MSQGCIQQAHFISQLVEHGSLDVVIKPLIANGADLNQLCNGMTAEKLAEQRQQAHPERTEAPALLRSLRERDRQRP
jgi:hypothetical protein